MQQRKSDLYACMTALLVVSTIIIGSPSVNAQPPPPERGEHYGPWNRDLELWRSQDGRIFTSGGVFVERAGVPTLVKLKHGRLLAAFQWFPLEHREAFDQIAVRESRDHGRTWRDPEPITIHDMPEDLHRAFDPTLVSLDDGKRMRLYFTSERVGPGRPRGNRAIFSAISDDGIHYTFEPGQRFGFDEAETYDSAVAPLGQTWHLYCPTQRPGIGYHAMSPDGLTFTRQDDVTVSGDRHWLGAALAVLGGLRFYGTAPGAGWLGESSNGAVWSVDKLVRLPGADPGVVVTDEGVTLLISTGPLRADSESGPPP